MEDITVPLKAIQKKPIHADAQHDAERRDCLQAMEEKRRQDGSKSSISIVSLAEGTPPNLGLTITPRNDYKSMTQFASGHIATTDIVSSRTCLATDSQSACAFLPLDQSTDDMTLSEPQQRLPPVIATKPDIKPPYIGKSSFLTDQRESLRAMEVELKESSPPAPSSPLSHPTSVEIEASRQILDIALISGSAFHLNCKNARNELFGTSLYEIDPRIEELELANEVDSDDFDQDRDFAIVAAMVTGNAATRADAIEARETVPQVPAASQNWINVFSKRASNVLSPHRPIDHKIELDRDRSASELKYSPLYKMSLEELQVAKQYIEENLDKGFIEPSQAPFASTYPICQETR